MSIFNRLKNILKQKTYKPKEIKTKTPIIGVGTMGRIGGLNFTVLGKIVYDWGGGSWTEYYIEIMPTNEFKWLAVEGTTYELSEEVDEAAPDPKNLREGSTFEMMGEKVYVEEVGRATITLVEGEFPFEMRVNTVVNYADCEIERTGKTVTVEKIGDGAVEVSIGEEIPKSSIEILG
ncbi:MAG TPA: DUF4178 domain-containing protein [Methanosarcinales archaeon]|nr:DUF4178 domain-containing protein [Methanosarcinales archaeon]